MFNMKLIGKTISEYRKVKNLTQMELADLLSVSHQAISNWERGETMPDISKLPELAEIFGISIDELLNNEKGVNVIKDVISGKTSEKVSIEEFRNISPILKPNQINKITEGIEMSNFNDIISILPFLGEEAADKIVLFAIDKLDTTDDVVSVLPFVSESTADQLVLKLIEINGQTFDLNSILPFISTETADQLVMNRIENKVIINNIVSILPFISEKTTDQLVTNYLNTSDEIENIGAIMPFVSTQIADSLVLKYVEKHHHVPKQVLPFISSEIADKLVLTILNK